MSYILSSVVSKEFLSQKLFFSFKLYVNISQKFARKKNIIIKWFCIKIGCWCGVGAVVNPGEPCGGRAPGGGQGAGQLCRCSIQVYFPLFVFFMI